MRILVASLFALLLSAEQALAAESCQKSVIVPDACLPADFSGYLLLLISRVMPLVLFGAVVMVAFSGVQYMLGGVSKDGSTKAKQRIIGSIAGVIFFLLITLIVRSLSNGVLVGG